MTEGDNKNKIRKYRVTADEEDNSVKSGAESGNASLSFEESPRIKLPFGHRTAVGAGADNVAEQSAAISPSTNAVPYNPANPQGAISDEQLHNEAVRLLTAIKQVYTTQELFRQGNYEFKFTTIKGIPMTMGFTEFEPTALGKFEKKSTCHMRDGDGQIKHLEDIADNCYIVLKEQFIDFCSEYRTEAEIKQNATQFREKIANRFEQIAITHMKDGKDMKDKYDEISELVRKSLSPYNKDRLDKVGGLVLDICIIEEERGTIDTNVELDLSVLYSTAKNLYENVSDLRNMLKEEMGKTINGNDMYLAKIEVVDLVKLGEKLRSDKVKLDEKLKPAEVEGDKRKSDEEKIRTFEENLYLLEELYKNLEGLFVGGNAARVPAEAEKPYIGKLYFADSYGNEVDPDLTAMIIIHNEYDSKGSEGDQR